MAEALPHSLGSFQPTTKPTFPGGMLELEITPEKVWNKDCRKPAVKECKKRVAFSEDVNRVYAEKQVIDNKSKGLQSEHQQYPSLENPKLNSTYGVTKQMEKLKLDREATERKHNSIPALDVLQSINDRATVALNFKRNERHFEDLIPLAFDKDKELAKVAAKRSTFEKVKLSDKNDLSAEDIMTFWTDDLLTDYPKLDYDRNIHESILEPDTSINSVEYLTDLYFCKEVASQFR